MRGWVPRTKLGEWTARLWYGIQSFTAAIGGFPQIRPMVDLKGHAVSQQPSKAGVEPLGSHLIQSPCNPGCRAVVTRAPLRPVLRNLVSRRTSPINRRVLC
jgi:hypothetical protein